MPIALSWILLLLQLLLISTMFPSLIPPLTQCPSSSQQNLVTKAPAQNLPAMLVAKLLPFVKNLAARKWSDEDVPEDVQFLRDELKARFDSLTTYDEYTSELSSGHLSWSPVHTSDAFWKENAQKLNEGNYEQLKSVPSPNFVLYSWYHSGILIRY
jgi:hypothetical protein